MKKPRTVEELVIFQSIASAVFMTFKNKGLNEEQVAVLLDGEADRIIFETMNALASKIDKIIATAPVILDPINEEWMVEVANRAVEANLKEDGSTTYESAQGFACALEALKIASKWRGDEFKTNEASDVTVDAPGVEDRESEIRRRAIDLFNVTNSKYGTESAAKAAFEYIAEQNGVVTIEALGLTDDEISRIQTAIVARMFNLE